LTRLALQILPVRQVVVVEFLASVRDALARYGRVELEDEVRGCIRDVVKRTYTGLNVDVRSAEPADYALVARVVVADSAPNIDDRGRVLGKCGLDNSGDGTDGVRDRENVRLEDVVGGGNATGSAGNKFGGVFPACYLNLFSTDRVDVRRLSAQQRAELESFEGIFNPVRPDRGGRAVTPGEREGLLARPLETGSDCPARGGDRQKQVSCAAYALYGGSRSFIERVPLNGDEVSMICQEEADYLRSVLPSSEPDPLLGRRPPCDAQLYRP
jgi:hypothetical protein